MNRITDASSSTTVRFEAIVTAGTAGFTVGLPEWIGATSHPGEVFGELLRCLFVTYVLARLVTRARISSWREVFTLGAGMSLLQPAILLGSLLHEHMPLAEYCARVAYSVLSDLVSLAVLATCCMGTVKRSQRAVRINLKAVVLASVAALAVGGVWYSPFLFGGVWAHFKTGASVGGAKLPPLEGLGEFAREAVVACVFARFLSVLRATTLKSSVVLGGAMWLCLDAPLVFYAVVHKHMPLPLFAVHAGHRLANDLVIAAIVGAWRLKSQQPQGGYAALPHEPAENLEGGSR